METFHGRDKGKRVRFGAFEVDFQGRELTRSEEHTSELQSQSNLVCRLLLEKKKTTPPSHRLFRQQQPHHTPLDLRAAHRSHCLFRSPAITHPFLRPSPLTGSPFFSRRHMRR